MSGLYNALVSSCTILLSLLLFDSLVHFFFVDPLPSFHSTNPTSTMEKSSDPTSKRGGAIMFRKFIKIFIFAFVFLFS